jgi:hypothetical protein
MESLDHFDTTHIIVSDPTKGQSIERDKTYKMIINSFACDPMWVCYTLPKFGDSPGPFRHLGDRQIQLDIKVRIRSTTDSIHKGSQTPHPSGNMLSMDGRTNWE